VAGRRSQVTECNCTPVGCQWSAGKPECFPLTHFATFQQEQIPQPRPVKGTTTTTSTTTTIITTTTTTTSFITTTTKATV